MAQLGESVTDDHDGEETKKAHKKGDLLGEKDGTGRGARTRGLWIHNPALLPTELSRHNNA